MPEGVETTNLMQAIDLLSLFSSMFEGDRSSGEGTIPKILGPSRNVGIFSWKKWVNE